MRWIILIGNSELNMNLLKWVCLWINGYIKNDSEKLLEE